MRDADQELIGRFVADYSAKTGRTPEEVRAHLPALEFAARRAKVAEVTAEFDAMLRRLFLGED